MTTLPLTPTSTRSLRQAARLIGALVITFAVTAACFALSTILTEMRARRIETVSETITANAVPSIIHLDRGRSELRRVDFLLDRLERDMAVDRDFMDIQMSREAFEREWSTYKTLPQFNGETELWASVDGDIGAMNTSIDRAIGAFRDGRRNAGADELNARTWLAIEKTDQGLRHAQELNEHRAAALAARIGELRSSVRTWAYVLDGISALFATVAAILAARVVSRFAKTTEIRVSELERFAGRVAHDVRSPLTSVGLTLERARQNPNLDEKTLTMLGRGLATVQRVGDLVDGLLVFARAGAAPPGEASAEVAPVLLDIVDALRPIAEEKGIELHVEKPIPAVTVACTPGVLSSLIANIVGNAIKHMGEVPVRQIEIAVRDQGSTVSIEVRDTGPGIPPALRARIWDPYVRGPSATTFGLGLGLATVRRLVDAHGGRVGLESGKVLGSLFFFELPKAPCR